MTPRPDPGPPDFIEAVFTCRGNFYDPNFPQELEIINRRLQTLLRAGEHISYLSRVATCGTVSYFLFVVFFKAF